jgi:hypothetical protein
MGSRKKKILESKKWRDMMTVRISIKRGRRKSKRWIRVKMRRMKYMSSMRSSINRFIKICL